MGASAKNEKESKVFDPRAWGLPGAAIKKLGHRLNEFWERYAECFETQTRDTSDYALDVITRRFKVITEEPLNLHTT